VQIVQSNASAYQLTAYQRLLSIVQQGQLSSSPLPFFFATLQDNLVLSCATILACPNDLRPRFDLSYSTVLHVVLSRLPLPLKCRRAVRRDPSLIQVPPTAIFSTLCLRLMYRQLILKILSSFFLSLSVIMHVSQPCMTTGFTSDWQ